MKEKTFKRLIGILYAAVIIFLSVLFFTNDFGIVDLRKTSVIIGVGIDIDGDDLVLTAQLAVPQPAENGENTKFSTITGKGKTVACAINDVNVKTGFYPKLVFCKLVLLGESCFTRDTNTLLNYFFDNEYTGLTPKIAACSGKAGDMLSLKLPFGDSTTDFIERILSEEAQRSGNVSTADLNEFGQAYFTKSQAAYMPFIEFADEEEGNESGNGQSGGGQSGGQSGGGDPSASEGGGSGGGEGENIEFMCNRTAVFSDGVCKGILDEEEAFAFNLLNSKVRHAYTECGSGDERSVLGLRNCKGDIDLKVEKGIPTLTMSFKAIAKVMDDAKDQTSKKNADSRTPEEALKKGEKTITEQMQKLFKYCKEWQCDILGAKDLLYKKNYKYYDTFKDILYDKLEVKYEVKLKSIS